MCSMVKRVPRFPNDETTRIGSGLCRTGSRWNAVETVERRAEPSWNKRASEKGQLARDVGKRGGQMLDMESSGMRRLFVGIKQELEAIWTWCLALFSANNLCVQREK